MIIKTIVEEIKAISAAWLIKVPLLLVIAIGALLYFGYKVKPLADNTKIVPAIAEQTTQNSFSISQIERKMDSQYDSLKMILIKNQEFNDKVWKEIVKINGYTKKISDNIPGMKSKFEEVDATLAFIIEQQEILREKKK